MKLAVNLTFFLFALVLFENKSLSLNDYKIKKSCKNEKYEFTCIKNLQEKRSNLQRGNKIAIPVIPYKK